MGGEEREVVARLCSSFNKGWRRQALDLALPTGLPVREGNK